MNYSPAVYTAWLEDGDENGSFAYGVAVLTICGGAPFTVPTYRLHGSSYKQRQELAEWFKSNESEPEALEGSSYDLSDFDIDPEVLEEIESYLNGEALEISNY